MLRRCVEWIVSQGLPRRRDCSGPRVAPPPVPRPQPGPFVEQVSLCRSLSTATRGRLGPSGRRRAVTRIVGCYGWRVCQRSGPSPEDAGVYVEDAATAVPAATGLYGFHGDDSCGVSSASARRRMTGRCTPATRS